MVITVVGLGVIGGSFVKALKGLGYEVYGVDVDEETLMKAKNEGCIIEGYQDGHEIIKRTDLTIISLYPSLIVDFVRDHEFKKGSIITDVLGVKSFFIDQILEFLDPEVELISGHPMAGREKKGYDYASAEVFKNANYIITPHSRNTPQAIALLEILVRQLGFRNVQQVNIHEHDQIISFTSQLPHVLAVSLMNADPQIFDTGKFIGDSFRDLTRIANINEDLWYELFSKNKDNLLESIEDFERELDKMKDTIENDDEEGMKNLFRKATERRAHLEKK